MAYGKAIGVIGHTGMVGSQVYQYFKAKKVDVFGFSIDKKKDYPNSTIETINQNCDIIFICVPTPYDWQKKQTNLQIVEIVMRQIKPGKIVVIKSTVWPGTTDLLQKKYPKLYLLFNPEFLSRKTAREDFLYPDRQLMGYTQKSKKFAKRVLKILPHSPYSKAVKAAEAELIKYSHNVWGAVRITYANHLYEISEKLKLNYDTVKDGFVASKFIGDGMLRYMNVLHHNGKRGYGGPCFPKDVNSFLQFCKKIRVKVEVAQATKDANVRILKKQGLNEELAEKTL